MANRPQRGLRGEHVYLRPLEPEDADLVSRWYGDDRVRKLMGDPPLSHAARRARYETAVREDGESVYRFVISTGPMATARSGSRSATRSYGAAAWGRTRSTPSSTSRSASSAWSA